MQLNHVYESYAEISNSFACELTYKPQYKISMASRSISKGWTDFCAMIKRWWTDFLKFWKKLGIKFTNGVLKLQRKLNSLKLSNKPSPELYEWIKEHPLILEATNGEDDMNLTVIPQTEESNFWDQVSPTTLPNISHRGFVSMLQKLTDYHSDKMATAVNIQNELDVEISSLETNINDDTCSEERFEQMEKINLKKRNMEYCYNMLYTNLTNIMDYMYEYQTHFH